MLLRTPLLALGFAFAITAFACSDDDPASTPATPDAAAPDASLNDRDAETGPGLELGTPITAPPNAWTFVPFADSSCANGSPTGIGINPGTSKRLVIYLEGGGACWDQLTCYIAKTAANLDGWDEAKFNARAAAIGNSHFDRAAPNNPYRDASFVYVPYCTGDVHSGDREQTYDGKLTKHVGRRNLEAFLKRIAPTFPDADRVVLTGASAGGFGSAVNYWRVKRYFAEKRVDLVDDSGPPFPRDKMAYFASWLTAWDLQGAIVPDCAECADGNVLAVLPHYSRKYPDARFALLSYDRDQVISGFFGLDGDQFASALAQVTTEQIDPLTNFRVFELSGSAHTMLGNLETKSAGGKALGTWLGEMDSDAEAWTSVKPGQ